MAKPRENEFSVTLSDRPDVVYTNSWTFPTTGEYADAFQAHCAARSNMVKLDTLRGRLIKEGKLTEVGLREQLQEQASEMREAARLVQQELLAKRKSELHAKGEELVAVKPREPDDITGHLMDKEMRVFFRGLKAKEREAALSEALSGQCPELAAAIIRAPSALSGVTAETKKLLTMGAVSEENLPELEEISRQADAIEQAEATMVTSNNEIARIAGLGFKETRVIDAAVDEKIKAATEAQENGDGGSKPRSKDGVNVHDLPDDGTGWHAGKGAA